MKAFAAIRRGRPPKAAAANDNADNAQKGRNTRDEGTPELRRMRAILAGSADTAASVHPLALMLAKDLISEDQHRAGWRFAALYRLGVGRTDISYRRLYEGLAGESGAGRAIIDEVFLARARERYLVARRTLEKEGRAVTRDTENMAVFGIFPDFLFRLQPTKRNKDSGGALHLARLCRGLDALERGLE
jgi:hypothetical protein